MDHHLLHKFPKLMTHLFFANTFNKDSNGIIPNSVTHLTFGHAFNQDIKGCIPESVTHLTIGSYTSSTFDDGIRFHSVFLHDITGCVPYSVIELIVSIFYPKKIMVHDTCKIIRI